MDQRIKKIWIEALRSGKYKRTRDQLKDMGGFCVLGVLCDIFTKEKNITWDEMPDTTNLPGVVQEWSKISSPVGSYSNVDSIGTGCLVKDNDVLGLNFNQLADIIEENF